MDDLTKSITHVRNAPETAAPTSRVSNVEHCVCGFAFSGRSVALILKLRPSWQRGRYNGVGGHIEAGETPHQAMVREFREETGVETYESDWTEFCALDSKTLKGQRYHVHFFSAGMPLHEGVELPQLHQPTDEEPIWMPVRDVTRHNCMPNLTWLVPMALAVVVDPTAKAYTIAEIPKTPEDILPSRF